MGKRGFGISVGQVAEWPKAPVLKTEAPQGQGFESPPALVRGFSFLPGSGPTGGRGGIADALDLGSSRVTGVGSSPIARLLGLFFP